MNTVTSYHTFVANTKARASQVNTNFSNHRGDLVPINTDTFTASDLTHDLGAIDHRWDFSYCRSYAFADITTAGLFLRGETTGVQINFWVNNSITARVLAGGFHQEDLRSKDFTMSGVGTRNGQVVTSTGTPTATIATTETVAGLTIEFVAKSGGTWKYDLIELGGTTGASYIQVQANAGVGTVSVQTFIDGATEAVIHYSFIGTSILRVPPNMFTWTFNNLSAGTHTVHQVWTRGSGLTTVAGLILSNVRGIMYEI